MGDGVRICMRHKNRATTLNALIKAEAKKGAQKGLMHIQGEKAEEVYMHKTRSVQV